ncbi:hypothetical protein SAMN05660860_02425 [Geoalkalibacter ferrihydriticus]|uniref:Uncharacterized protein n=2 Tax=Geoalkalibacter ferrihydriticus TaxID=392333 RepID=A0A0C2HLG2_9BACT|nr:hypothetical protein [Geoalkalibacter ferrihydriticus]KIH77926.1 hypothetical protein GFER_04745 [Geoalkalibacter ferrihydriticus DSM 17813]SDM36973.1 hypothetical protein SAMN05660860_02425 [Geoalkalibacter ferrihydriticus]
MILWLRVILLILVCVGFAPLTTHAVRGELDGSLEWRYGAHSAKERGEKVLDASWFAQQYSLLYRTAGDLARGRAGNYNLALGYEWTALDGSINGESTDVSLDKILYQGDILIAPGGLPLHLHLYSHDLHRSTFSTASPGGLFESLGSEGLGAQNAVVGIHNGQQNTTGLTLMLGSASGDYEGMYRDVLAHAPRLLIDYRQHYVRDLKGFTPQHYRDRNLAFVSLNKKDNWFHYRVFDHKDFINPNNDFIEKAYIIGTIDHTLQRRWVRLTNWIEFSVDGTYSTSSMSAGGREPDRRYDLNAFTVARRKGWEVANFTTFRRDSTATSLQRDLTVPIYVSKNLDPETTLRTRFIGAREDRLLFASDEESTREVVFLSNRIEALQRQPWSLTGQFDAERKTGDRGEGVALRALAELFTNRAHRPQYDIFSAYSLAYFGGEGVSGDGVDFWEQTLTGRIETDLAPNYRTGLTQEFLYGTGNLDRNVAEYILPRSDLGLLLSGEGVQRRDGTVLRSTSTWFGEYRSSRRLTSRLELVYDFLSDESGEDGVTMLSHRLRYDQRRFLATLQNRLVMGSHRVTGGVGSGSALAASSPGEAKRTLETRLHMAYFPVRSVETSLRIDHDWRTLNAGDSHQYLVEQRLRYNYFQRGGMGRKLYALGEEFIWERLDSPLADTRMARTLTLSGEFFPSIRTLLGLRLRYRYLEPEDTTIYTTYLTAGINWEKLQIALDYSYGTRDEGAIVPERKEHRWEMRARKTF